MNKRARVTVYMQTIIDILQRSADFLQKKGVPSPRVDAEWLLSHALKIDRMKLLLQSQRPLAEKELDEIRPLIQRRAKREPLQYIIGTQPFIDLVLKTDPRALIPRPETEELVYLVKERVSQPASILDMGTGTGAIALSLALIYPEANITASDFSKEALSLAEENAELHHLSSQISFLVSDWYAEIKGRFDVIISNPPYLTEEEWKEAEPEVKDNEPATALWAKESGLSDLEKIISRAPSFLHAGGWLFLETGIAQRERLQTLLEQAGFVKVEILEDFSQRDRYVCAQLAM